MACKCYHAERNFVGKIGVCYGTKEKEACSCGGDESKCDFYDYVRERASLPQKQTNADRIRAMTDEELAEWFIKVQDDVADYYDGGHAFAPELPTMENSWLDWLKQEAKE